MPTSLFEEPFLSPVSPLSSAAPATPTPVSAPAFPIAPPASAVLRKRFPFKLIAVYTALFVAPIASAFGMNAAASKLNTQALLSPTSSTAEVPESATLAEVQPSSATNITPAAAQIQEPSSNTNDLEYELSLANGFLKKAVDLSTATTTTAGEQTPQDKETIIGYLNQALEAANRAIALAPADPRGYTSRGRVYQATSAIKPEMKTLADQDFAKASSLGATNPMQAPATQNPTEYLPTQQASQNYAINSVIAGPQEQTSNGTVNSSSTSNANKGTATLQAGATEVFVPYAAVKDTTQLYVAASNNPENITLYVKNKEAGSGFTIGATAPPSAPLEITWFEIQ